jgi:hypothetical protein
MEFSMCQLAQCHSEPVSIVNKKSVVMLSVVFLSSVVMLNVIMLNVAWVSVVAPMIFASSSDKDQSYKTFSALICAPVKQSDVQWPGL